jgi:hypothetical protein
MRDSKNILHAKLGVSPMERQYGGGLDAAYMNRRRSSAFAAPDATSAFASPMSKDGLPTIYREQGGPLPITSVYGQGIPRIIKQNREASKAGNLFPGFNILTGKPLTPPEQLRAALPFVPSQKDIKDEREFQEGKIWADKVNKEMKEDKEKEDAKEFDTHLNRQAGRIINSNLPPADKIAARNSLKDTINNYRIEDKGTVTKIVDSIVRGSEINRKTGGGLPTIYRQDGGDIDFGEVSAEDMVAAYEDAGIDTSGFDTSLDGSVDYADPPQGSIVPTSDDKIDITEFPTDPNVGVFGRPLQTPAQIKSRLSGDKPEDGYTRVESAYLNDILAKNPGMTINQAENYLASAMATPGGIAAMERGFYSGYTGGGAAGTLQNFLDKSITGTEEGLQKLLKDRKKEEEVNKEEKSVDKDSTLGSLLNYLEKGVSKLTGGKSLTPETIESMQSFAKSQGDSFTPRSGLDKGIGAAISAIVPGASFIPQSVGVYRTKNGLEFNVSKDGSFSLEMPFTPNIDYNELDEDTTSDKPEKKKKEIKEEEKKNYMKDYFSGLQSLDNTGDLKNFYERKSLEYVYPNKTSAEINAMINKP